MDKSFKQGVKRTFNVWATLKGEPLLFDEDTQFESAVVNEEFTRVAEFNVVKGDQPGQIIVDTGDTSTIPVGDYKWDIKITFSNGDVLYLPEERNATLKITQGAS